MALTSAQITTAFQNVLQREPSAAELSAWLNASTSGALTDAQIYAAIVNSAEALNGVAAVLRVYQAAFGRVADKAGLDQQTDSYVRGGFTINKIAEGFVVSQEFANRYNGGTLVTDTAAAVTDALLQALYQNVLGRAGSAAEIAAWKATLTTPGSGYTKASDVLIGFSQSVEFTNKAATGVATFLTAAAQGTAVYSGALLDNNTLTPGQTFTLTDKIDSIVGTSGNDLIQGVEAHYGALDTVAGGLGTDTLSLALTSATVTLSSAQISGVETISINQGTNNGTVTLSGLGDVTALINNGSTKTLTVDGVSKVGSLTIQNTSQNTTVTHANAAVTGTADVLALTVSGVTGAAQVNVDSATGDAAGVETVNLTATGVASSITLQSNDTSVGTLTISGSSDVTVAMGTNVTTTAKTVNASAATGKVSVTGLGGAVHTVTGGTGNDTFGFGANFVGAENATAANRDVVDGGAGTDTISMNIAQAVAASAATQTTVKNIEVLEIADAWTTGNNFDATKFGVTGLKLAAGTAGTSTATVASGTTITLAGDSAANSVTSFVVTGTGTTDTVTLAMAGFDFAGTGTETFTGVETLNIQTGTTVTDAATFANALVLAPSAGVTNGSIVATGANALTLTGNVTAGSIDGSGLTGVLTVSGTAANAITILGGSKNDDIAGSAANDLLKGNNGADKFTGRAGNDSIDLSETAAAVDTVVLSASGANGSDTITAFQAGNTATSDKVNVVAMTAGAITAGATFSGAAAADATASRKDFLQIFTTDGSAASITSSGTKTLAAADFTAGTLTKVAEFIAEKLTGNSSTTDADTGVYVFNYTAAGSTTTYVYQWDNDTTANVTQAGELALVATITRDAALVNGDFIIA